jgi:hypothetical protein
MIIKSCNHRFADSLPLGSVNPSHCLILESPIRDVKASQQPRTCRPNLKESSWSELPSLPSSLATLCKVPKILKGNHKKLAEWKNRQRAAGKAFKALTVAYENNISPPKTFRIL